MSTFASVTSPCTRSGSPASAIASRTAVTCHARCYDGNVKPKTRLKAQRLSAMSGTALCRLWDARPHLGDVGDAVGAVRGGPRGVVLAGDHIAARRGLFDLRRRRLVCSVEEEERASRQTTMAECECL